MESVSRCVGEAKTKKKNVNVNFGQCKSPIAPEARHRFLSFRPNVIKTSSTYGSVDGGRDVLLLNSSFHSPPAGIQTSCPGLSCSFCAFSTSPLLLRRLRHRHYCRQNHLGRAVDLCRLLARGKRNSAAPQNHWMSPSYLETVSESSRNRARALRALPLFEPSLPEWQRLNQRIMVAMRRCASNARV